jgi:predicted phosphoribosyltransferase
MVNVMHIMNALPISDQTDMKTRIFEIPGLRNRRFVFKDRRHGGRILAAMMEERYKDAKDAIILGIPSGGVPVAIELMHTLRLPMDLLIIRKIPVPGNPEAGIGALTLTGRMLLNQELIERLGITPAQIEGQLNRVKRELEERNRIFRQGRPEPDLTGKRVIIADDGLASGFTTLAAVETARGLGAEKIAVAAPTGSGTAIQRLSGHVDEIFCPNIRTGHYYAVAEAYENWYDLDREEVVELLRQAGLL